jgi:hypothetical protein
MEYSKELHEQLKELSENVSNLDWIIEHGDYSGLNWLIGSVYVGNSTADGKDYEVHITTDSVHASQYSGDAKFDAEYIVKACNAIPALLSEIDRLQKLHEWIPVTPETMPEVGKWVLAYPTINGQTTKKKYIGNGQFYTVMGELMAAKVTHWQPLPLPPQEQP